MLPKDNRLTKKRDFETVFKNGSSAKSAFLICKTLKNGLPVSRVGLVVSKKVSGKATVRNKVKRMLRSAVANQMDGSKSGLDMVLVALPDIKNKDFTQIQKAVSVFFKK